MVMNADKKSSQTQIAQATLDETNQSVRISLVSGTISVPPGLATEAKQDVGNVSLSSIDGKLPTLGQKNKAGSVSVTLASDQGNVDTNSPAVVDAGNSSTTPLGVSSIFTGAAFDAKDFATLSISVVSDVSSATNGLSVQFSQDGTNWDHAHTFTYTAGGNGLSYNLPVEMRYVRVVYTNDGVAQTNFRLQSLFRRTQVPPSVYTIAQGIYDDTVASPTKSVIFGKTTGGGGGYVAVKVNPSGALTTEVSGSVSVTDFPRLNSVTLHRNNYSTSPVTTGVYVELVASMPAAVKEVEIFDSSGETLVLAIGGVGSEVNKVYIFPGGNGRIPLQISASARLSVKAVSNNATSGELTINFYG
jgi:hypothetical protein